MLSFLKLVDSFARLIFYPLAGSHFPKFSVFHYGGDKAKLLYSAEKFNQNP